MLPKFTKRFEKWTTGFSRFSLQLEQTTQIRAANFNEINHLNMNDSFSQCVKSSILKFFNNVCPEYFNETYFPAETCEINTRSSFKRLKQPLRKSKYGLNKPDGVIHRLKQISP